MKGSGSVVDKVVTERLENVLTKGRTVVSQHRYKLGQFGDRIKSEHYAEWCIQSLTLLGVVYGPQHVYAQNFDKFTAVNTTKDFPRPEQVEAGLGVLEAAAEDHAKGYTWTFREIVHAEVFDDFLEMAASLVSDGYKDAAAVIAGSTLEEHLRKLCQKNGIDVTTQKPNGAVEPKKASTMNQDLWKYSVYNQIEWRTIQGWLDIRNDAAHGHYDTYMQQQVEHMIDGIRGFFARHHA